MIPRILSKSGLAAACVWLALLVGCTAPASQPEAASPAPATPVATPAPAKPAKPLPAKPLPAKPSPAQSAPVVSRACRVDADCAVKDIGSCCGYFPACVAKDAKPDPAAVKAQCAANGMASTCGFREIEGCSCVAGECQDAGSGLQVR